jgi:quercetin dioxygenase-like cupin family protein
VPLRNSIWSQQTDSQFLSLIATLGMCFSNVDKEEFEMRATVALLVVFGLMLAAGGQDKSTPQGWTAKTIQWQTTSPDGTKWAVLQGKADVPGEMFTYAAFVPAGYHDRHSHSSDVWVAVAQGTLKISFGNNQTRFQAYPVGSVLFVPANEEHIMAADEDTILIGTATGPWGTHHHEEHQHH